MGLEFAIEYIDIDIDYYIYILCDDSLKGGQPLAASAVPFPFA